MWCVDVHGKTVAVGCSDGSMQIWDATNGVRESSRRTLRGHKEGVTCVCLEDEHIVTGAQDGSVRVWGVYEGWSKRRSISIIG